MALVESCSMNMEQVICLRVSDSQHNLMQTLKARSNSSGQQFFCYPLGSNIYLTKELAMIEALSLVSSNNSMSIFSKFLSPRKHRPRYHLDQLDSLLGKMEMFVKEAEKA